MSTRCLNESFLYLDHQIVAHNSGPFADLCRVTQVLLLVYSLFLSQHYINGGRLWFLAIIILSLLHLILSDWLIIYMENVSSESNGTVKEAPRAVVVHSRAIAPFTHYFGVTLLFILSFLYEMLAIVIRIFGRCTFNWKESFIGALNIAFWLISLLVLPQSYYSSWNLIQNFAIAQIRFVCAINAALSASAVIFLCCIKYLSYGGYDNEIEEQLARRRAIVKVIFYIIAFLTTMLTTPWPTGLFEFNLTYEVVRFLGIFSQIISIPLFIKCFVFAELPFGCMKSNIPNDLNASAGTLKEMLQFAFCLRITRQRQSENAVAPGDIPMNNLHPQTGNNVP